ncbi:hypothetical protein tpqmel_0168 [Candidatus Gastranaerophilus sp. (ex Termes propinquus)]|nr:hypothetical protein tpqmel_0168 [Candidatus Gastranaerophilus sp. (ex Termes propinquus)]
MINNIKIDKSHIYPRTIDIIKYAWGIFSKKVGGGMIQINKEASMQLHFAHVLQQVLSLIIFQDDEKIDIKLETSITDGQKRRETDIFIVACKGDEEFRVAIELKCYKEIASSGGKRGAGDIFMKDVYIDLHLLERYCENDGADYGIGLVMTNYKNFVYPKKKGSKCWDYDISDGTVPKISNYNTPIGGKPVDITLKNKYKFNWIAEGDYYFALLEPLKQ